MNLDLPSDTCSSKQEYAEIVNSKYDSLKLLTSLARHDIMNLYKEINYYNNKNRDRIPTEFQEEFTKFLLKLSDTISLLSSSEETEFHFMRVLIPILRSCQVIDYVDCSLDTIRFKTDVRFFVSVLTNVINNAKEAYSRKHLSLDEFKIVILYENGFLLIDDNAGGFEIDKIDYGKTDKTKEEIEMKQDHNHGFFLKTMLDKSHLFNMEFQVSAIPDGTRIALRINNCEGKPNDKSSNEYIPTN